MEYRDYYATLDVPRTASQADIKTAFRRLARKHHPEVNKTDPSAEARFKEVNEAYAVLGEPDKRKAYDALGSDWEAYQRAGPSPTGGGRRGGTGGSGAFPGGMRVEFQGDAADLAGFSDFFRTFFAGGAAGGAGSARATRTAAAGSSRSAPSGRSTRRGGTQAGPGGASLDDLLTGFGAGAATESGVRYGPDAKGGGASGGTGTRGRRGSGSGGAGMRRDDLQADVDISLEEVATGTQRVVQIGERRLEVSIPAGVDSGHRIRLSGKAGEGPGAGHVYLNVTAQPHPVFGRDGANLSRELPVSMGEALLGSEVPVATLNGKTLLLRIPAGTQTGRVFRLAGQGLPRFRADGRGDLFVRVRVVLPADLDAEGRRLAQQLVDHIGQADPRASRDAAPAASVT